MDGHEVSFSLSAKGSLAFGDGQDNERIEFTDRHDRPLLVALQREGRRLGLICRLVAVALRDTKNRVYVRRRPAKAGLFPHCWDLVASGPVLAGEAREDAARRQLAATLCCSLETLESAPQHTLDFVPLAVLAPHEGDHRYHLTVFRAGPIPCELVPQDPAKGLFLDRDELEGLAGQVPELLTPLLLWAIGAQCLWPKPASKATQESVARLKRVARLSRK